MVLTPAYLERMWTRFERQQIIEKLAVDHGQDAVLPVRLDGFSDDVPGLSQGIGYLAVSSKESQVVADNLLRKLGHPGYELDSTETYERALRMLSMRDRGVLSYDRMYTSVESLQAEHSSVVRGEVLQWIGDEYVWKRESGQPLILYARNEHVENTKDLGLVELARFEAPQPWIGCGRWTVYWLSTKVREKVPEDKDDNPALFLALHLGSTSTDDVDTILSDDSLEAAFLAALFLKGENAQRFYDRAETRFRDLR